MADSPALNKPASGSYGEGKAMADLQANLPQAPPQQAPQGAPPPPVNPANAIQSSSLNPEGRPPTGATPPPGIPAALAAPTNMPSQPLTTPVAPAGGNELPSAPDEARLVLLQAMAQNPNVSQDMRNWARQVVSLVLGAQQRQ